MQTILPPSGNTIKILGKARSAEHGLRWMHYVLAQPVEGGVLVFHTLTRALLLLTPEEYAAPDNLPELRDGWFRVPQEMDDMKYADQVRFIRRTMWKEPEHITTFIPSFFCSSLRMVVRSSSTLSRANRAIGFCASRHFSGELDLDIPPPLIRRKNSNRVEYNVHFSSYVGTFSIFPFIFRQKEKSHRPSDQ